MSYSQLVAVKVAMLVGRKTALASSLRPPSASWKKLWPFGRGFAQIQNPQQRGGHRKGEIGLIGSARNE